MSISNDARLWVMVADHVASETGVKQNMIGVGWTVMPLRDGHATHPMGVSVIVDVPTKHKGEDFTLEIFLRDEDSGLPVSVPSAEGEPPQVIRMSQVVRVNADFAPGIPVDLMPFRYLSHFALPIGLPLTPGHVYSWVARIDGNADGEASCRFFVPRLSQGPVIG